MATFLQTQDGDLAFTAGKLSILQGARAGAVNLFNRFRLFQGEWFRDRRVGVPYYPAILGAKKMKSSFIQNLLSTVIRNTPGIKSLDSITVTRDGASRSASVSFAAKWDDGATITAATLDKPFLVTEQT